jgi:hypothetical protein
MIPNGQVSPVAGRRDIATSPKGFEILRNQCDLRILRVAKSADTVSTLVPREGPRRVGDELV